MLDIYDELKALVSALEERGADYALCGGLAMAVYHVPRATIDIDLLVPPDALDEVKDVAGGLGFSLDAKPMVMAGGAIEIARVTKADPAGEDQLMLDLVLVTPRLEHVWSTRTEVEWEEGLLSVVSREGLVEMQSLRGSGQDLDDIRSLEEAE